MCFHVVYMEKIQYNLFKMWLTMSSGLPSRIKSKVKWRIRLSTWNFIVSMSLICKILGWDWSMLQINFACNIDQLIWCIIGSGGGPYLFGDLEDLQKNHASYMTGSSPRCPLRSHSLVCIKNQLFIVGIGPILNKELEFTYLSDRSDRKYVYS